MRKEKQNTNINAKTIHTYKNNSNGRTDEINAESSNDENKDK